MVVLRCEKSSGIVSLQRKSLRCDWIEILRTAEKSPWLRVTKTINDDVPLSRSFKHRAEGHDEFFKQGGISVALGRHLLRFRSQPSEMPTFTAILLLHRTDTIGLSVGGRPTNRRSSATKQVCTGILSGELLTSPPHDHLSCNLTGLEPRGGPWDRK